MIENSLLRQFAEETCDEFTVRLVTVFDEAIRQDNMASNQAVLQEAIRVLEEHIDETREH